MIITGDRESNIADDISINMDLIKIYVSKDEESRARSAMYVSKTLTVNALIYSIAARYYINPNKSVLSYLHEDSWQKVLITSKRLAELGISTGTRIIVTQEGDHFEITDEENYITPVKDKNANDDFHERMFDTFGKKLDFDKETSHSKIFYKKFDDCRFP